MLPRRAKAEKSAGAPTKPANKSTNQKFNPKNIMSTSAILMIILIILLIGALPAWPYSNGWGYYPSGGLGLVVLILLILLITGRL
jgi:Protein of unknown function (DUF3309)